jgi:hypothetical protein
MKTMALSLVVTRCGCREYENPSQCCNGGWGYSSFDKDGKPTDEAAMKKCFPCHQAIKDRDFVFTRYSP